METISERVGARVAKLINQRGHSQAEAARAIGVSSGSFSRKVSANSSPFSLTDLEKLVDWLNTSWEFLCTGRESAPAVGVGDDAELSNEAVRVARGFDQIEPEHQRLVSNMVMDCLLIDRKSPPDGG